MAGREDGLLRAQRAALFLMSDCLTYGIHIDIAQAHLFVPIVPIFPYLSRFVLIRQVVDRNGKWVPGPTKKNC